MQEWRFSILHFTNNEVVDDLDNVINKIDNYLSAYK
jgi:very-short-patch-repair endonuclease